MSLPEYRKWLTVDLVRALFDYNPSTGVVTRRVDRGGTAKPGTVAGSVSRGPKYGYRRIRLREATLFAHRIAWLHFYGVWPTGQIDHINGIRDDNRISNLRDVTGTDNAQNRRVAQSVSTTGFLGVMKKRSRPGFEARIRVNGTRIYLGYFKTPEEAHAVYVEAKRRLHRTCTL